MPSPPRTALDRGVGMADVGVIALGSLVTGWFALRGIDDRSFWADEGVTAFAAAGSTEDFLAWVRREPHFALYVALVRTFAVFGNSELVLRLPSVLFVVACVPVLHATARRLFGSRAAVGTVAVFSVHGLVLGYAQEARPYSFTMLLTCVATWRLACALDEPGRTSNWVLWLGSSGLSLLSHPFAITIVVAHLFVLAGRPTTPWRLIAKLAALPVGVLGALAVTLLDLGRGRLRWIPPATSDRLWGVVREVTGSVGSTTVLTYIAAIVAAPLVMSRRRPVTSGWAIGMFVAGATATVPVVLAMAASFVQPLLVTRYLIVVVPGVVLLVGGGLSRLERRAWAVALLAVVAVALPTAFAPLRGPGGRHDFRAATAFLTEAAGADDLVIVAPQGLPAVAFYLDRFDARHAPRLINGPDVRGELRDQWFPCAFSTVWLLSVDSAGPSRLPGLLTTSDLRASRWFLALRLDRLDPVRC